MNKVESNYLLQHGITLQDWDRLLDLIDTSLYLKVGDNYAAADLTEDKFKRLIYKFKKADLIKEVKGDLRLDPYFYTRNDTPDSVLGKLKKEWEGKCRDEYPDVTDEDGVIHIYDPKLRYYREATVKDFIKREKNNEA